jgi:hypothetical protein
MADFFTWPASVIDTKTLNVGYSKTFPALAWLGPLDSAIDFLNNFMKKHKIALTYAKAGEGTRAQLVFDTMPGNGIHGQAELAMSGSGSNEHLTKITIKVPATPRISQSDPKSRIVGDGIKTCILVHEMIHGLGLPNAQHTNADVFSKVFQLLPGNTGAADKMQWDASSPSMPPPVINDATLVKIKRVWPAVVKEN